MSDTAWEPLKRWLIEEQAIDESVVTAEALKRLDLSGRSLEELPESIGLLSGLVALNLAGNNLKTLPDSLSNLSMLNNLDIRRNRFEAVPSVLSSLTLRSLNASGNKISDITVLKECRALRVLDLSNNDLTTVEGMLAEENDLRTLNLSGNFIKEIDASFASFAQVERLNLSENVLMTIPKSIEAMHELVEINLSDNRLTTIDEAFFFLGLEEADLSSNQLKDLYLHDLDDLEIMILDSNPIQKIEVDESFAPYLKEFSCDSCELQTFVWVPSLELASLCFSSNAITTVPEEIGKYTKLRQLDLDGNGISELPNAVANMTRLQTLYIGGNPLNEEAKKVIKVLHPDICDINMKTGITIERAQEEDLPEMAELIGVLFAIEVDFEIDYEKQLAGIKKLHVYEGADMLVAKHEGKVVGMVTMQRLISSAAGDFIGQIEDLVVHEEYRKMGVGSRLINKMRFIAIEEYGYKRIQLAADMDNTNALQFYTRRGFRRTNLNVYHLEKN
ncbi:MAG: GNAT family N-acetyltransferase [Helicobacteraceae bacterium]|jgi:Leucine-rich repeat (LRR) protein|nr:GNAT family N-acetyltransferase [Helicobacteraceae bacterium]